MIRVQSKLHGLELNFNEEMIPDFKVKKKVYKFCELKLKECDDLGYHSRCKYGDTLTRK